MSKGWLWNSLVAGWPCAGAAAAAVLQAIPAAAQCPRYTIEVISGEPCGKSTATWVYPTAVNQPGHVAGHINVCQLAPSDAFTWDGGEIELVPMPAGTFESSAHDLNDNSWVVGEYVLPPSIPRAGFLTNGVQFTTLLPELANWSVAFAVNNDQVAVGFWYNTVTGIPQHACIWSGSTLTNIDGLPGPNSNATDINALGQVCGWSGSTNSSANARGFVTDNGSVTILPPIPEGGESSVATAINDAGHVAGWGRVPSDGLLPFLRRGFLWIEGEMTLLGVLPGMDQSITFDMNDADQIVGHCHSLRSNTRGFLWDDGVMIDLNDFVPSELQLNILSANAINPAGQIACWAYDQSISAGVCVLLTPAPPADLDCDGIINAADLELLLAQWGKSNASSADFDGDGLIGPADLAELLANWTG